MELKEKKIDSKKIFSGKLLDLYEDEVICPNDIKATREYVIHCKAAAILPITKDGYVILEKQYRYPLDMEYIEVPAGKANGDEPMIEIAKRELEEETGLTSDDIDYVGDIYPACAYSTEKIGLFIAKNLKQGTLHRDFDEFINIFQVKKILLKCARMVG